MVPLPNVFVLSLSATYSINLKNFPPHVLKFIIVDVEFYVNSSLNVIFFQAAVDERGTVLSEVSMERSVSFVHLVDSFSMTESRRIKKKREIFDKNDKLLMESESDNKSEKLRRHESSADRKFDCPLCGKSFSQKYLGKLRLQIKNVIYYKKSGSPQFIPQI